MNTKRKAKKVLRQFGKEAYKARIQYINSFADEEPSFIRRISYRHMMKRCAVLVLILMLSCALLVVTASAFGIHILNFSFSEKSDHTEIISLAEDDGVNAEVRLYEVTYVPEGYELIADRSFLDNERRLTYENGNGQYLHIEQHEAEGFNIDVNNEGCTIRDEMIGDIKVKVYDYGDHMFYMFQYYETVITIHGAISSDEFVKIIDGLGLN